MPKPTTIQQFRKGSFAAENQPSIELDALENYIPSPVPILPDIYAHIYTRMEIEQTKLAIAEFKEWPIESRKLIASQNYIKKHAQCAVAIWHKAIKAREAKLPGLFTVAGKKLSLLAVDAFLSDESREANRIQRENIEAEVDEVESSIQIAKSAVRGFELMPTNQAFEEADARVNELITP